MGDSFPPAQEFSLSLENGMKQPPNPSISHQNSLVVGSGLHACEGVEENKWLNSYSCVTEISIKYLDMREKIRDNLVPFLMQELGIPPSTLLAKWQHLPWREVD